MDKIQEAIEILKSYNQESIIKILNKLSEEEKEELAKQIIKLDFHQVTGLYKNTKKEIEIKENKLESVKYCDKEKLSKEEKEELRKLGEDVIRKGQYAVVTMAGGQGTRLGHKGPKGTFMEKENIFLKF